MIITYYGASSFKVQFSDTTLAFNPVSKSSTYQQTKFGSDICFISNFHPDTAGEENAGLGNKQPFVIAGPGEYEVQGVFAKGFETVTEYGGEKRTNIVYSVTLEGMNLIFLGALSSPEIPADVLEGLGEPDILFVPIGGQGTLSPNEAYKLSLKLEANIVIPMFYSDETLRLFQGEEGEPDEKALDKLTIKKKEVDEREGDIVVLRSSA